MAKTPSTDKNLVKKIPLVPTKTKVLMTNILVVVFGFYIVAAYFTKAYPNTFFAGLPYAFKFVVNDLYPPNWGYIDRVLPSLIETWNMALLSTTLAAIFALPLCFLASSNINKNVVLYQTVRFILNILRTIPELILALLFVTLMGLGALAGIGALFVFSLGIIAKLISETVEAVDPNPLEAIRATGGNIIQVIWYGVIPQILPHFVSYTLYVLEINVRSSVILGFVGAGGIGLILKQQLSLFNFGNVSTIIIMTFVAVTIIDYVSNTVRGRLV